MEDNTALYDKYILSEMTPAEEAAFKRRLSSDTQFAKDFRIYLFTLKGIRQEVEQDNIELATALKSISKDELLRIIGRNKGPKFLRIPYLRERMAWAASVAVVLIIGFTVVFQVNRHGQNTLDNTLVAYNYVPVISKDAGVRPINIMELSDSELKAAIPALTAEYDNAPADDMETAEQAGMRLAMAYLKLHDRKQAIAVLEELTVRFADDAEFIAQCDRIIEQLK